MTARRSPLALALALAGAPALAQEGSTVTAEVRRALADQPFFPSLRGGSLGVPTLTGEGQVGAQGALRSDTGRPAPVLDLFARLGNLSLGTRTSLSLFAESALLQAPRVSYNPSAVEVPDPVFAVQDQSFQGIGFRIDVRLTGPSYDEARAASCFHWAVMTANARPGRQPSPDCPRPTGNSTAALTNVYYQLRAQQYLGLHAFAGARYLYRGSPTVGSSASGVSGELGLVGYAANGLTAFGSTSVTWLARDRSMDGSNLTVLPSQTEVRLTAGIAWRPSNFDPARSATFGLQGSASWNFWDNEFARGAQPLGVRGRSLEASLFLSGHVGSSFNGLISFGVLVPYGQSEDGPRFVFTFAPAVAAATDSGGGEATPQGGATDGAAPTETPATTANDPAAPAANGGGR